MLRLAVKDSRGLLRSTGFTSGVNALKRTAMTPPPPVSNTSSDVLQELFFQRPVQSKVSFSRALREIAKLRHLGIAEISDLCIALWELALANCALRRHSISTLGLARVNQVQAGAEPSLSALENECVARVRHAFEVMAPRVPWRSDCLIQCIAARRWLSRQAIASRIAIGVKRGDNGVMLAHAWLCAGEIVVTGGDVSDFQEFRASRRTVS